MRPLKKSDKEVFARLADTFRKKGYEGASYADLMAATGLVKASLYHRFPGGKEEMVDAVLSNVDKQFADYVLHPAYESGPPAKRAKEMAARLREFYSAGKQWCLLDTLTVASNARTLEHAKGSMEYWIESLARVARDAGLSAALARSRAEDAVAAIEGGLVVSRVARKGDSFLRALVTLPERLTKKERRN